VQLTGLCEFNESVPGNFFSTILRTGFPELAFGARPVTLRHASRFFVRCEWLSNSAHGSTKKRSSKYRVMVVGRLPEAQPPFSFAPSGGICNR